MEDNSITLAKEQTPKTRKIALGDSIIIAAVTLVIGVVIGINWNSFVGGIAPYLGFKTKTSADSVDWSPLDEVYTTLSLYYDGEIDKSKLVEGAKAGLVASLGDKYTVYMTATENADFQNSLHGEVGSGVGIVMAERDGYIRVVRTLPDNPARKAGILAGDILYKVNDEDVYAMTAEEIANKVRGPEGSEVKVTVVRDNQEKTFTMKRENINNVSADLTYLDTDKDGKNDTAYILTTRFDTDTGTKVREFAQFFSRDGIKKVILDLRDNGGGYTSAAKDLLGLWIDGDIVYTQKTGGSSQNFYAARSQAILGSMKTIVLVNEATASASEIVAGALKDYGKATIVGTSTYGKGVVQSLIDLSNNSLLKVTSAHWYTPKGSSIDQTGITPDVEVKRSYDDINSNKDPQLDKAKSL
ncbi:S41 family peptidase [Candidatus Saccharibacteria bacterium]|nr:S41 family peptidase [Candidatus Saccharibacteria bacterium]